MFADKNKILYFDVKKLEELSEGNDKKLVWLLYKWWRDKDTIRRKGDKFTLKERLSGTSFLLKPDTFFTNGKEATYMAQYIRLAGRRDLFLYNTYSTTTLHLSYYSDLNLENIKRNPLLTVTDTEIHFNLEK